MKKIKFKMYIPELVVAVRDSKGRSSLCKAKSSATIARRESLTSMELVWEDILLEELDCRIVCCLLALADGGSIYFQTLKNERGIGVGRNNNILRFEHDGNMFLSIT